MKSKKSYSNRVFWYLIAATLAIFFVHTLLKYISVEIYNEQHGSLFELSARFDVNDENSAPQWFSQMLFLMIGVFSLFAAYLQDKKSNKYFWAVIGALGLLLSFDDVSTMHEFVLQNIHNTFFLDTSPTFLINAWLVILPFVLVIGAGLAYWGWQVLPRRTFVLLVVGGLVYVLGKIAMDSISNDVSDMFLDRGVMQGLEKVFQYTGSSIVLYAVIDYLETNYGNRIERAINHLK